VANGFKAAGGSLAVLPRAVGSVAGKVGGSTGEGAKKLAAAPAAGLGAIGHGISKMNPFHKDEAPTAVAQKPTDKSEAAKTEEPKTARAADAESEKTASAKTDAAANDKVAETNADKDAAAKPNEVAEKPECY